MSNDGRSKVSRLGFNEFTFGLTGVAILLFAAVLWSARSANVEKTDFSLTYVGATMMHQGLGNQLYDITLQQQVRNSLFKHPNPLLFEHPPFEALLFSPLAVLPFRSAYMVWGFLNALLLLILILLMRPHLARPREDLGYVALWILFAPTGVALFQGQTSLLVLAAYCAVFVSLKMRQEFAAGAALGLGLFKFQFVLPFVLIFILRKQWRFFGGFCLAGFILILVSGMATGIRGMVSYIRFLSAIGSNPQNLSYGSAVDMPTLHGFTYAVASGMNPLTLNIVVLTASVALLFFIAMQWHRQSDEESGNMIFGSAIAASLLCGLHMFTHDFSPLILAMFIGIAHRPSGDRVRWLRVLMIFSLVVFWFAPGYFVLVAFHGLYLMCPVLLIFIFSGLFAARHIKAATRDRNVVAI